MWKAFPSHWGAHNPLGEIADLLLIPVTQAVMNTRGKGRVSTVNMVHSSQLVPYPANTELLPCSRMLLALEIQRLKKYFYLGGIHNE